VRIVKEDKKFFGRRGGKAEDKGSLVAPACGRQGNRIKKQIYERSSLTI